MNVDLRAAFLCAHAAAPHMRAQGGGRIINFSDWIARSGRPRYAGYLPYYVAKAGVIALTEALALELAADNILVNAIAPGPILAPPGTTSEETAAVEEATPLGRWGGEMEIAQAVARAARRRFHHRRDHPRRRRPAPEIVAGGSGYGSVGAGTRRGRTSCRSSGSPQWATVALSDSHPEQLLHRLQRAGQLARGRARSRSARTLRRWRRSRRPARSRCVRA